MKRILGLAALGVSGYVAYKVVWALLVPLVALLATAVVWGLKLLLVAVLAFAAYRLYLKFAQPPGQSV